jgi:hypothetical protein
MNWQDFIRNGKVKKGTPDEQLVVSLVRCAKEDLSFMKELIISEKSSRKIIISYYDTLRSILEAMAAKEGFKVYSHEAFTTFLKEKKENILAEKFDRFRKIRNKLNYYGSSLTKEEAEELKDDINQLIDKLMEKYLI